MVEAGTQLSQYRIVRRIGAGGMAEVFLAQVTGAAGFTRPVAIKTILAAGAPQESIGLFLDEARVAALLHHASIVQTLDLGFENDTLFIVMEYVPGPPLSRVIQELKHRKRTLPPHVTAFIGAKMAAALDFAHRRVTTASGQPLHLVHRDVSPQNILVTRGGMVKLTDFGVARASIQMHKTKTGQVRGKAAYMAPEQVRAQPLDGRTDMFALALVLYEALTAFRPYQRANEIASMRAIIGEDVPPIRERNPSVPDDLVEVIMKALRRPPNERYANCAEFEEALSRTFRSHRVSAIEEELAALLVELFGEEQHKDALPDVEGWQPTINVSNTPVTPRFRVPGNELSPEIAAMLGQGTPNTPPTPATPQSNGMAGARTPVSSLSAGNAPQVQPPPGAFTRAPLRSPPGVHGTNEIIQSFVDNSGPLTPDSANLRITVPPGNTPVLSQPRLEQPVSPMVTNALVNFTPPFATSPSIPKTRGVSPVAKWTTAFGATAAGVLLVVLLAKNTSTAENVADVAAPVEERSFGIVPAKPSEPPPPVQPPPARREEPRRDEARREEPPREERIKKEAEPKKEKTKRTETKEAAPPAPPPPQPQKIDRGAVVVRIMELKKKAESNPKLAQELGDLANDLLIGREPTQADLDFIKKAEKELR